jgi:hypothetical protein
MTKRLPDSARTMGVGVRRFTIPTRTASSAPKPVTLAKRLRMPVPKRKKNGNKRRTLAALKTKARAMAEKLGHKLINFSNAETMACSTCKTCEAWVQVDLKMRRANEIVGPAVVNECHS